MRNALEDVEAPPLPRDPEELELSVVLPCLNEADTVEACIRAAQGWIASAVCAAEDCLAR